MKSSDSSARTENTSIPPTPPAGTKPMFASCMNNMPRPEHSTPKLKDEIGPGLVEAQMKFARDM